MGGLTLKGPNGSDAVTIQQSTNVTKVVEASDIASDAFVKSRIGSGGAFSFRNKIVDGRFDFWYEGTSQTTSGYGSDTMSRNANSGSTKVHSQQPLVAGVDLPAIEVPTAKYFSRTVVTSIAGADNYVDKWFRCEGVNTFAGKTVTLSFYAKADAVKNIAITFQQYFGGSGSPSIDIPAELISLSTVWKRYAVTITLPAISGKTIAGGNDYLGVVFVFDTGTTFNTFASNLGQQSGIFDIACVQLEEGSVATPFEELPIEVSQQRVNRYWELLSFSVTSYSAYSSFSFKTVKRATPTLTLVSGGLSGTTIVCSSFLDSLYQGVAASAASALVYYVDARL